MFTKMAIRHLRKRIVKIDDENERLKAKAFLNLIEQFLKRRNNSLLFYFFRRAI